MDNLQHKKQVSNNFKNIQMFMNIIKKLPPELVHKIFDYDCYKYQLMQQIIKQFKYINKLKRVFVQSRQMKKIVYNEWVGEYNKLFTYENMNFKNICNIRALANYSPCCDNNCCYKFGNTDCPCCPIANGGNYISPGLRISAYVQQKKHVLRLDNHGYCVSVKK